MLPPAGLHDKSNLRSGKMNCLSNPAGSCHFRRHSLLNIKLQKHLDVGQQPVTHMAQPDFLKTYIALYKTNVH